jgi:hypothetical protein
MRVIALIDDPGVVRRILEHLGRSVPEPAERQGWPLLPLAPYNCVAPSGILAIDVTSVADGTHGRQNAPEGQGEKRPDRRTQGES